MEWMRENLSLVCNKMKQDSFNNKILMSVMKVIMKPIAQLKAILETSLQGPTRTFRPKTGIFLFIDHGGGRDWREIDDRRVRPSGMTRYTCWRCCVWARGNSPHCATSDVTQRCERCCWPPVTSSAACIKCTVIVIILRGKLFLMTSWRAQSFQRVVFAYTKTILSSSLSYVLWNTKFKF